MQRTKETPCLCSTQSDPPKLCRRLCQDSRAWSLILQSNLGLSFGAALKVLPDHPRLHSGAGPWTQTWTLLLDQIVVTWKLYLLRTHKRYCAKFESWNLQSVEDAQFEPSIEACSRLQDRKFGPHSMCWIFLRNQIRNGVLSVIKEISTLSPVLRSYY